MKKDASDFLTHKQRVKFVGAVLPFITIFTIPLIAYSSPNKLLVIFVCLLPPIVGLTFLKLSTTTSKELLFKIFPVAINGLVTFFICWFAGDKAPSFLAGIPLIGACALIFSNIRHLIVAIIYAMACLLFGSYLAGKTTTDLFAYFALLFCYSFMIVRMLQFIMLQGNEIMLSQKKIEEQKRVIEEKQNDILGSIRYAKRIQTSLMPTEKYIYRSLNKHKA